MQKYTMKDYFTLDGVGGFALSMVGLLATGAILWTTAISTQKKQAVNPYSIDTNIHTIKAIDTNNKKHFK